MGTDNKVNLPYFDHLLTALNENNKDVEKSFGRHVHWGYWQQPGQAEQTADDFAAAAEKLTAQICSAANIKDNQRILDVGCGFGGTLAYLNENYNDMELLGLNLDDRQLVRARKQVHAIANNKIQFQQGNANVLPFPDNSFDVVLAVECIFHFPDRKQFFQEANRVLKPGGYLALSDFVPSTLILPITRINLTASNNPGFYGRCNVQCTAKKYRQLAENTGFVVQVENDITRNTLPTYTYLRSSGRWVGTWSFSAVYETLTIEGLSRAGLLKYMIYSFKKQCVGWISAAPSTE